MVASEFYKKLGLTDNQTRVLCEIPYGKLNLKPVIEAYKKSKDYKNGVSFCDSLCNYAGTAKLDIKLLVEYITKKETKLFSRSEKDIQKIILEMNGGSFKNRLANTSFGTSANTKNANMPVDIMGEITCDDLDTGFNDDFDCCEMVDCEMTDTEVSPFNSSGYSDSSAGSFGGFGAPIMTGQVMAPVSNVVPHKALGEFDGSRLGRTDKYEKIPEKGLDRLNSSTSTFRATCNRAAFNILRQNYMNSYGILHDMVRTEEMINALEYNLENKTKEKFNITTEICDKPFSKNKLMYIGVKGNEIIPDRQNIVILLDVSGSMESNRLDTQASLIALVKNLNKGDKLSIITYSDKDNIVIKNETVDDKILDKVIEALMTIIIEGCTYGSKGLETAYSLIEENKISNGINRVFILTDGDFNFGVCDTEDIKELITTKKESGAFLSVLGYGYGNINDDLMSTLAKNGNGNYSFICREDYDEIYNQIYTNYNRIAFTIATDVKTQVEFNPRYVLGYRLIGYETRTLNHKDFKNDKVIAEPFGSGSHSIALYELELNEDCEEVLDLKYQHKSLIASNNLCTVSIRYKEVNEDTSKEISKDIEFTNNIKMNNNTAIAYVTYILAEKLRHPQSVKTKDIKMAEAILEDLIEKRSIDKRDAKLMKLLFNK